MFRTIYIILLFSDDATVLLDGNHLSELINGMKLELPIWLVENKSTLNTSNTHFMVFNGV